MNNYTYNFIEYLCENNLIKITNIYEDHIKNQIIISYLELNSLQRITTITLPSYYSEKIYKILNIDILPIFSINDREILETFLNLDNPSHKILLKIFTILKEFETRPEYHQYNDDSAIITLDNTYIHKIKNINDFNEIYDLLDFLLEGYYTPNF